MEPIDISEYNYISLPESSRWGLLMPSDGSPTKFIRSGLGFYLTTEDLLPTVLEQDVCFRPLNPPLEIHYALIWKRTVFQSKAAEVFLQELKQSTT